MDGGSGYGWDGGHGGDGWDGGGSWDGGYGWDGGYDPALSTQWQATSVDLWGLSDTMSDTGDQLWLAEQYEAAGQLYQVSYHLEDLSAGAYEQSWDAWYGPVNAEGYTAYDAAHGYTSMDTSLIEPATSAASTSVISSNDASSYL